MTMPMCKEFTSGKQVNTFEFNCTNTQHEAVALKLKTYIPLKNILNPIIRLVH